MNRYTTRSSKLPTAFMAERMQRAVSCLMDNAFNAPGFPRSSQPSKWMSLRGLAILWIITGGAARI